MPINTVRCPYCGARVNHIIRVGGPDRGKPMSFEEQTSCPRCKKDFAIGTEALSKRALQDARELYEFGQHMGKTELEFKRAFEDDGGDAVESALAKAGEVFTAARHSLDEIKLDAASPSINADELLTTYSVPDVKQFTMGRVTQAAQRASERYGIPDSAVNVATDMADRAFDQAAAKIQDKIASKLAR